MGRCIPLKAPIPLILTVSSGRSRQHVYRGEGTTRTHPTPRLPCSQPHILLYLKVVLWKLSHGHLSLSIITTAAGAMVDSTSFPGFDQDSEGVARALWMVSVSFCLITGIRANATCLRPNPKMIELGSSGSKLVSERVASLARTFFRWRSGLNFSGSGKRFGSMCMVY